MNLTSLNLDAIRNSQAASLLSLGKDPQEKWLLQSDLLYELMTYGDGLNTRWPHIGNWNNPKSHVPRAVLTWLTMRALGLERLPWLHDRVFSEQMPADSRRVVERLRDPVEVESATDELRALHEHTVKILRQYELDPLLLSRSVEDSGYSNSLGELKHGYASRLAKMACAAARLNRDKFTVPIDVLTSWAVGGYPKPVTFTCLLAADCIGWGSALVGTRDKDRSRDAVEGGEWVVVCRDASGLLNIPTCGVSAWPTFRASPSKKDRAHHDPVSPDVERRLDLLKIDRSLHPKSREEAEELLASGATAYGAKTSGYDNMSFNKRAQVKLGWQERASHAACVLFHGHPKGPGPS